MRASRLQQIGSVSRSQCKETFHFEAIDCDMRRTVEICSTLCGGEFCFFVFLSWWINVCCQSCDITLKTDAEYSQCTLTESMKTEMRDN